MKKIINVKRYDGYGQITAVDNKEYMFEYNVKGDLGQGVLYDLGIEETIYLPIVNIEYTENEDPLEVTVLIN